MMTSRFHEYMQLVDCEDMEKIVLAKMDADVNRDLSESGDDYEQILENYFRDELMDGRK